MIEYLALFAVWTAFCTWVGLNRGEKMGYEKAEEMWRHDSSPVTREGFDDLEQFADVVNNLGYDGVTSVQTREYPNGDPVWFVENRETTFNVDPEIFEGLEYTGETDD